MSHAARRLIELVREMVAEAQSRSRKLLYLAMFVAVFDFYSIGARLLSIAADFGTHFAVATRVPAPAPPR